MLKVLCRLNWHRWMVIQGVYGVASVSTCLRCGAVEIRRIPKPPPAFCEIAGTGGASDTHRKSRL